MSVVSDEITFLPHSSHWGAFSAGWQGDRLVVKPHPGDPDPNLLCRTSPTRCATRRASRGRWCGAAGWSAGPGPTTGAAATSSCRCPGTEALDLLAAELRARARRARAAGDLRRLLRLGQRRALPPRAEPAAPLPEPRLGGYVRSVNSYSSGAVERDPAARHRAAWSDVAGSNVTWDELVAEHSELVLAFGGMALKNSDVGGGGISRHIERDRHARGAPRAAPSSSWSSPLRDDLPAEVERRMAPDPPRHRHGADARAGPHAGRRGAARPRLPRPLLRRLGRSSSAYLLGRDDGQPKDAAWAAAICGLAGRRRSSRWRAALAGRRSAGHRRSVAAARRARRAAGLDGRRAGGDARPDRPAGRRLRLCAGRRSAIPASRRWRCRCRPCRRAATASRDFIPVARIADMLLHPGEPFDYNGQRLHLSRHPAGLLGRRQPVPPPPGPQPAAPRLRAAGHGRRARDRLDRDRAPRRHRAARDDHAGARGHRRRAERSAAGGDAPASRRRTARRATTTRSSPAWPSGSAAREAFTEGRIAARSGSAPLRADAPGARRARHARARLRRSSGQTASCVLPTAARRRRHRCAPSATTPTATPLPTPSGRIELFSETIAGFGYADCPGHPTWLRAGRRRRPPTPALPAAAGRQPAGDAAAQPARFRRHQPAPRRSRAASRCASTRPTPRRAASPTATSCASSTTAAPASPARVAERRHAARASSSCRPAPGTTPTTRTEDTPLCVHGNPNVLTRDAGTSRLAQGCTGQLTVRRGRALRTATCRRSRPSTRPVPVMRGGVDRAPEMLPLRALPRSSPGRVREGHCSPSRRMEHQRPELDAFARERIGRRGRIVERRMRREARPPVGSSS